MGLNLRGYQADTLEALRKGFAAGNRSMILYAPTGAGKTEMAIALLEATNAKGNKAAMLLDRIILCDQTSQRLEKYKIEHGVLQSGHWRYRPYENIQICSAQTIEKRGSFPNLKILIIDECHTTRAQTVEFIKNNPDVKVIGLSATPFTKGLGNIYETVISTITTREWVDQKVRVPLKVFVAKEINMEGASKVAGEWSQKDASTRGKQITGDIVAEWVKKTHEIYGRPRKTIIFCAGVDHGADLSKKFAEQGYNFISISYKDDDEFKRDAIEDFSKPDTEIHGLIATDILTKGFDVPDVMIGVSARPFTKSLSSHIQQMGRVMRGMPNAPEEKPFAVWLCHSGNYLRFREDWDDVYENGVHELDDGKEKSKPEKTETEKKEAKCPVCSHLWPIGSDTCYHCGHTRERLSKVAEVAGEMEELKGAMTRENKQDFWSMCQYKIKYGGWSDKRALAAYKNQFGVWPKALHTIPMPPDVKFEKSAKAAMIRYLKGKQKGMVK
jgi:superfamily II DNA or RNA helicase